MKYMVTYVDGSARPNPGITGWGLHSYIGEEGEFKQIKSKFIASDKGYVSKKMKSKVKQIKPTLIIERYGKNKKSDTNNTAELDAFYEAIKLAKEYLNKGDKLTILTDSEYVRNLIAGYLKTGKHNYKSNLKQIDEILKYLKDIRFDLEILKVEAHIGQIGNEEADRLSNIGRKLKLGDKDSVYKEVKVDFKDYWFHKPDVNEFISKDKKILLVLKNDTILDDKNLYTITNYKKKDIAEIGKKGNFVNYDIIRSNKPI